MSPMPPVVCEATHSPRVGLEPTMVPTTTHLADQHSGPPDRDTDDTPPPVDGSATTPTGPDRAGGHEEESITTKQRKAEPENGAVDSHDVIDRVLRALPGGADPLAGIHDTTAQQILDLAESLVDDARARLGHDTSKPRVADVVELFREHARHAPAVSEHLNDELRDHTRIEEVDDLDLAWDKSTATATNTFDQVSVESGSKVQEACDNWRLAVRVYESEARSAGAIFRAEIEKAHHQETTRGGYHHEIDEHVGHHSKTKAIAGALVVYEEAMASAATDLATGFGDHMRDLFDAAPSLAVGEAALIAATETASETFWTGVHDQFGQAS